jgi:D-alanyl-D-alanine carboxypeptidase (penicillin-binding protein 5/6)
LIAALLAAAAVAAAPAPSTAPTDPFPSAAASYIVAIDGQIVWERDADTPRLPASLTKMMTALLLVERDWDPGAAITISASAAKATGSRAGLKAGEVLIAKDLLTAMLVTSANDACVALAEHAAGDTTTFVARMNARAKELGLNATRFANPCGHDDPGQRSSAYDLAVLAEEAMTHSEIASTVSRIQATIRTAKGRKITVKTGNHLLGRCEGAYGVKTGYTPGAGKCLVAAVQRGRTRVLVVLLDAADRWWSAAGVIEMAFDEAHTRQQQQPR